MSKKIQNDIVALRKELGRKSLLAFAKTYFKHYCTLDFAPFQLELIKDLEKALLERGRQLAVAAPRGNAKSSLVSLMYILWCACYKLEPCIVIFSSTKDQSEKLLTHVKDELSSNKELIKDFPEVCVPPNPRWRKDEIITKNGVNIRISSVEHGIRGMRYKEHRPTLIILDDVESEKTAKSREGRENVLDWFSKLVLNLGSDKTNYIVVGTILHFDSLLANLTSKEIEVFPGFERKKYKSVIQWAKRQDLWDQWSRYYCSKDNYDKKTGPKAAKKFFSKNSKIMLEGAEVLWPEKENYYDLMVIREQKGEFSFASEKQNEPKDPSTLSIDMNKVVWWDEKFPTIEDLVTYLDKDLLVLGAIDPSVGKNDRSDYSAIITGFVHMKTKYIYVVDADIGRWELDFLVKRICFHHKTRRYAGFVYEANASQAWLGNTLKKEPDSPPIEPVINSNGKEGRVLQLICYLQQGRVQLSKRLTELNRQLSSYPNGAHDDGVDALAMLVEMAERLPRWDGKRIAEIIKDAKLRQKFKGYDPKKPNKWIGRLDKDGKFRPFNLSLIHI